MERVPDGSFNMVFGYLNRNHVEPNRAAGRAQNTFEPVPPIAGSRRTLPARDLHLPREHSKEWDKKKELVLVR